MARWTPTLYFVIGQIGWFACVLSAAHGIAWVGVALTLLLIALHLRRAARPIEEIKLLACVVVMGAMWESALVFVGLLAYPGSTVVHDFAPPWILALWALFAAQFNTTYQWLKKRIALAALFGAVAGPVSFHAGAALGAVRFVEPWPAAAALAVGWAIMLPTICVLARRWDGVQAR